MRFQHSHVVSPWTSLFLLTIISFSLGSLGCQRIISSTASAQEKAKAAPATAVVTVRPERKTIRRMTEQPGHIEAIEETPLFAKISGFVREVSVDIGDRVTKDQVLAELLVPEMVEELKQKQAMVAQAKSEGVQATAAVQVAAAGVATAKVKITETLAATKRSEADYDRWKAELARIERLAAENAIQKKVVEETQAQFRAADAWREEAGAKIESARAGLAEAEAKLTKANADVTAATAKVAVAEADEGRMKAMLEYAKITAPFAGVVTQRNVHTGHFIPASGSREPLLVVIRTDPVRVFVDVPEKDATAVGRDNSAVVRVQALGSQEFTGTVARTAWALDRTARTLRTEIDVPNADGKLRPGMYVYTGVVVAERKDALAIPASALVKQAEKTVCCCVSGGKIVRKPVTIGLNDGTNVEVLSGLEGTEEIVKANAAALSDGQAVQVQSPSGK